MKKNILITISLLLIIINAEETDTCTTFKNENDCKGGTNCEWTAGICKGDTGTTCSSVKVEATCTTTEYTKTTTPCTHTEESTEGSCAVTAGVNTETNCASLTSKAACTGETDCTWTPNTPASCAGHANCVSPIKATCEQTTVSSTATCEWEATGTCAKTKVEEKEENEEEEEDKTDGDKTGGSKTGGSGTGGSGTGTGNGNGSGSGSDSSFGLKLSGLIYLLLALF